MRLFGKTRARRRSRGQPWVATALAVIAGVLWNGSAAGAVTDGLPDSMAAIGDSITQATNSDLLHIGASDPAKSWSTGNGPGDIVSSHYERILTRNRNVAGRSLNASVPGAVMSHAPTQAATVVQQGAEYVTVLMGTNDVCASSKDTMTSVSAYESAFRDTMAVLTTGLPAAKIYAVSVPDVYQLWTLSRYNLVAQLTWEYFRICPSMLARSNTEADRQFARARNLDFNRVLRQVCAEYAQCRYDDDRVFHHRLTPADVSLVDYFHLSTAGQSTLAEITWSQGYWPGSG